MIYNRIVISPNIMGGKPVIQGTRITVEHVLCKRAGGMTVEEIQNEHPHLTPEDIYAAAAFAADHLAQAEIVLANGLRL